MLRRESGKVFSPCALNFAPMKRLFTLLLLAPFILSAQTIILQGSVKDKKTKESLPSANIVIPSLKLGTSTDINGFFRLNLSQTGELDIKVTFVGRPDLIQTVNIKEGVNVVVFYMKESTEALNEVVLSASTNVADKNAPLTFQNIGKKEIEKNNLGQDLPYLLEQTPSMVVGSDAGTGIGYTNMRLRGSDGTRINVSINGVPVNDAESQGVFWVDIPDLASSAENIQIQRGVSLSSQGAGSFGGAININTFGGSKIAGASYSSSIGSFNTFKSTLQASTGRLTSGWAFNGRLSKITSDGYIDRGSADLNAYHLGAHWANSKTSVWLTAFGGHERTYQSWYGVPFRYLDSARTFNPYTYEDEVDDYGQDYFQAKISRKLTDNSLLSVTLYRTLGAGYFEQFQGAGENMFTYNSDTVLADYGISAMHNGDSILYSDIIRRRWLDNVLDGFIASYKRTENNWTLEAGVGLNEYRGKHFGEVIWAEFAGNSELGHKYYDNDAVKREANTFLRNELRFGKSVAFADVQLRSIKYQFQGAEANGNLADQEVNLNMINPKVGWIYSFNEASKVYTSFGISNKEPNRNDYRANPDDRPEHETLYDLELGYKKSGFKYAFSANLYYMQYKNQLVSNGQLNDVGESLHENVDNSYRRGIELVGSYRPIPKLTVQGNVAFSQNKIEEYVDHVDNWDTGGKTDIIYENTTLAFSPSVVSGVNLNYKFNDAFSVEWQHKFVGKRYIDNTENELRSLDPYYLQHLLVTYSNTKVFGKLLKFNLKVNNLLNSDYISNAWSYRFISQGFDPRPFDPYVTAENENDGSYQSMGFFPQAFRNVLFGVKLEF